MANEKRVRQNFLGGLVDTADLTGTGTTLNSAGLAAITTTVDTTNHLPIILDPDGIYGAPEIAYITAFTIGATSATILRGQEGTTARAHLLDTPWVHGPILSDFCGTSLLLDYVAATDIVNGATLTADTWNNWGPSQSFTPSSASVLLQVAVRCSGFVRAATSNGANPAARILIDGTTAVHIGGGGHAPQYTNSTTFNQYDMNPFDGAGPVVIGPLSAASHTVQVQVFARGSTLLGYCRASTVPTTEFFGIQVVQLAGVA